MVYWPGKEERAFMSVKDNLLAALVDKAALEDAYLSGEELARQLAISPQRGVEGGQAAGAGGVWHRRRAQPGIPAGIGQRPGFPSRGGALSDHPGAGPDGFGLSGAGLHQQPPQGAGRRRGRGRNGGGGGPADGGKAAGAAPSFLRRAADCT